MNVLLRLYRRVFPFPAAGASVLGVRARATRKHASSHPGPSERARLHKLMIEKTREMRFQLGLPWRI